MSNVLPVIEMPKPPEPAPKGAEEISDKKIPELSTEDNGNMELIDSLMKEDISTDDDIIRVDEREIPSEDEVFNDPPPKVKSVSLEEQEQPEEPSEFPQKKGKRKYTRKAPMSDKQKEHLAKIRKIAQDKRKAEKERKQKEKEEAVIEKAEKRILEKKKKEEEKFEKEQHEKINSFKPPKVQNGFTKEDLDNAVLSAISQYDTLRKQQKKEKRELEKKKLEEEKMRATLARAIQPQQPPQDPWRSLFS
jgi:hypothetical protein